MKDKRKEDQKTSKNDRKQSKMFSSIEEIRPVIRNTIKYIGSNNNCIDGFVNHFIIIISVFRLCTTN